MQSRTVRIETNLKKEVSSTLSTKGKISILTVVIITLVAIYIGLGINANNWQYFLYRRVPKIIAIILTGGAIAFSSMVFQTITNNRILTPSILGLDSLYMFIQTFVIFIFGSKSLTIMNDNINFIISVGLMVVFSGILYKAVFKKEENDIYFLLLVGLVLGTLFQSSSSFMQMLIDPDEFTFVQDKMFASFNNVNLEILTLAAIVFILVGIYTHRYTRVLDVLSLGREQSINLGVDYDKEAKRMLVVVAILVSVSTALVGPITFLGLLVVNLTREFLDTYKHKYLIITSILMSAIALVGGQLIVERVLNFSTTLSVIINLIGGLYFIYLLLKENKA